MVAGMKLERLETWVLEAEGPAIEFGAGSYSTFKAMVVAVTTDDILAQAQGIPLYKALGGAGRAAVPVYGSKVYTADPAAMAKQAAEKVAGGHTAIKIQLGRSAARDGYRGDIAVTKAIREAVGPKVDIGADVNSAYD